MITKKEIVFERIRNGIVAETDDGKQFFPTWDDFQAALTEEGRKNWAELRHLLNPPSRFRLVFSVEEWNTDAHL